MAKIMAATNPEISEREIRNEKRARKIAAQGMVLLKNEGGALPLKHGQAVALYGYGARRTIKGGTGSGEVFVRRMSTVENSLKEAGFRVLGQHWLDKFDAVYAAGVAERQREVLEAAEHGLGEVLQVIFGKTTRFDPCVIEDEDLETECETAVYVLSRNSGEGADRKMVPGDYELSDMEKENLDKLTGFYRHVVVVLNVGGVVDTSYLRNLSGVDAILLMSQGGCSGGEALADVLSGEVTPSGHLAMTWAEKYEDYPCADTFSHLNGDLDDEYYSEGIYVGYRYFDTFGIAPAYPFGYGLSYTDFDVACGEFTVENGKAFVPVRVKNTGSTYSGREVVQVYVSAPAGQLEKPYQELRAFAKTRLLAPEETQELLLSFDLRELASYSEEQAAWLLEAGDYYVRVGTHSRNTHIAAAIRLEREVVVSRMKNLFSAEADYEALSAKDVRPYTYEGEETEKGQAPVVVADPEEIPCEEIVYRRGEPELTDPAPGHLITLDEVRSGAYSAEALAAQLSVEEMAQLCVGTARNGVLSGPTIGNSSVNCPGAAGDTFEIAGRGVPGMALADGPAGLRLTNEFEADGNGQVIPGTVSTPKELEYINKAWEKLGRKPEVRPEGVQGTKYYQYPTAIPIATLLAQTWDLDAVAEAGSIVGEEMKELGVTLWLAPGMNIQRNPLCGRNFEYYSEDPLLAGLCAAADTEGVQQHGGIGTTIKHFAMNNQEDNRTHVNDHASERTIREIYLRGFEIAVKRSQPLAIMSSYNLLNGVHTANSYDLLTAAARDEWGFEGLVMTDWGTTGKEPAESHKYGSSGAASCIKAGNDLIMPGSAEDVEEIIRAVQGEPAPDGCTLTLGELQACAARILKVAAKAARF